MVIGPCAWWKLGKQRRRCPRFLFKRVVVGTCFSSVFWNRIRHWEQKKETQGSLISSSIRRYLLIQERHEVVKTFVDDFLKHPAPREISKQVKFAFTLIVVSSKHTAWLIHVENPWNTSILKNHSPWKQESPIESIDRKVCKMMFLFHGWDMFVSMAGRFSIDKMMAGDMPMWRKPGPCGLFGRFLAGLGNGSLFGLSWKC